VEDVLRGDVGLLQLGAIAARHSQQRTGAAKSDDSLAGSTMIHDRRWFMVDDDS
jgi:hypothetical protein